MISSTGIPDSLEFTNLIWLKPYSFAYSSQILSMSLRNCSKYGIMYFFCSKWSWFYASIYSEMANEKSSISVNLANSGCFPKVSCKNFVKLAINFYLSLTLIINGMVFIPS